MAAEPCETEMNCAMCQFAERRASPLQGVNVEITAMAADVMLIG